MNRSRHQLDRRRLLAHAATLPALLSATAAAARTIDTGDAAPPLTLATSLGDPVLPADGAPGWRLLYLDFWASWCAPCRLSFPWMNALHDRHQAAGLRIVAVNLDARPQDAQDFLARLPARFALAFDAAGTSARAFGIQAMPSSYLLRPDRRVLLAHRGFRNADAQALERRIAEALAA